jgi:hypothetical protein
VPRPAVGYLYGVSCSSPRSCQAVGDYAGSRGLGQPLVESWDGAAWSVVPVPRPAVGYLYGVSCSSPRSCQAVGDYAGSRGLDQPLVESWDGTAWSVGSA